VEFSVTVSEKKMLKIIKHYLQCSRIKLYRCAEMLTTEAAHLLTDFSVTFTEKSFFE